MYGTMIEECSRLFFYMQLIEMLERFDHMVQYGPPITAVDRSPVRRWPHEPEISAKGQSVDSRIVLI